MRYKDQSIAIIGAGITGLTLAVALKDKGYQEVTLYESANRIGGKLYSFSYDNHIYEYGAHFGLPDQSELNAWLKRYNIRVDGPKLARIHYDKKGNMKMQVERAYLSDFIEELDRLGDIIEGYPSLSKARPLTIEADLIEPFNKWCERHGLSQLYKVYSHYFISYGLGDVTRVPAFYVLRVMSYENLMSFMKLPELCTFKEGISSLCHAMSNDIAPVRVSQAITGLKRNEDGVTVITDYESRHFDRVILTGFTNPYIGNYDLPQSLSQSLSHIKVSHYGVMAFSCDLMPHQCGCILDHLSNDNEGHMMLFNSRFHAENGIVLTYSYIKEPSHDLSLHTQRLKEDLIQIGAKNPVFVGAKRWRQAPYLSEGLLRERVYDKIESLQGIDGIYYAGEALCGVSIENCMKYASQLIQDYF